MVQEKMRSSLVFLTSTILVLNFVSGAHGWWQNNRQTDDDYEDRDWWEEVLDFLGDNWDDVDWDEPDGDQELTG